MKKNLLYFIYTIILVLLFSFLVWLGKNETFSGFIDRIEKTTFDLRQSIISKYKTPNKDIVIIAIDDATYEYIMDKYGFWPISRQIWSDTINALETAKPKYIIFDLLFIKANFGDKKADNALIKSVKKYDNVILSMNFDHYSEDIRKSATLDDKLKLKVTQGNLPDNEYITFTNSRTIMQELIDATKNIGIVNITRDTDGIVRDVTPVFKYKGDYYPSLSLLTAMNYIGSNSIEIKNNEIILDEKHKIPLDDTKRAVLNWYGKKETYKHIPVWQVIKAYKNNDYKFLEDNFKDKIIFIGTSATSLSDIKSVPTESNMAGVELHTTFLNNILDNNFIKKTDKKVDLLIALALSILVGYSVLITTSVIRTIVVLILTLGMYSVLCTALMHSMNLWIGIILPFISTTTAFLLVYCEKYILRTKDYEQTYKLAVTDGLTQLYNHRYFQEQMIINVNNYQRYQTVFSLILIDIDFFKKFNDTYGHQSGDCVLKQVANILKKNSRTSDISCRYGGEEMSIILTNTNKNDAVITANKICSAVRNNKFILANGEKVNVTISVGVSTVGINGDKPQEIIEFADKCLYKAKESGRNQVVSEID